MDLVLLGQIQDGETEEGQGDEIRLVEDLQTKERMPSFLERLVERRGLAESVPDQNINALL